MERRRKIIALQFRGKEILKKVFSSMFAIHFDSSGRRTKKARLIGINFDTNKKSLRWRFTERDFKKLLIGASLASPV